jgi:hypothetical protein
MNNEIRPTWKLAWGLWERISLITLGIYVAIEAILLLLGISLLSIIPWSSISGGL